MKILISLILAALILTGCGPRGEPQPPLPAETAPAAAVTAEQEPVDPAPEAAAMTQPPPPPLPDIPLPQAPGEMEQRCQDAVVDYSNAADGYVMVSHPGQTDSRLKVLIQGPTTRYSYDLPQGEWTVFPLSDGSGSYRVGVYRNVVNSQYATVLTASFQAELKDEFAPFLRPNQYVNYSQATEAVALGAELTRELTSPLEKVAVVYDYVVANLTYDFHRAQTVQSGYLPDLDQVLADRKGICFDYAALMTAMLRSQQIPCKLVVGYAGSTYHAWISVWTRESGWIDGVIFFDGSLWHRMDPTFASSSQDPQILDFIQNGSYTAKYLY